MLSPLLQYSSYMLQFYDHLVALVMTRGGWKVRCASDPVLFFWPRSPNFDSTFAGLVPKETGPNINIFLDAACSGQNLSLQWLQAVRTRQHAAMERHRQKSQRACTHVEHSGVRHQFNGIVVQSPCNIWASFDVTVSSDFQGVDCVVGTLRQKSTLQKTWSGSQTQLNNRRNPVKTNSLGGHVERMTDGVAPTQTIWTSQLCNTGDDTRI